jgi:hypothetical protein
MDQCLLYQLPNEILQDKLMALLPQTNLAAIRQASRLLHDLSTRVLYRRITLVKPSQFVKCCKVLMDTKFHVELVHEFVVNFLRFAHIVLAILLRRLTLLSRVDLLPSMIRLLMGTLKCLCFLRLLYVQIKPHNGIQAVVDACLTFPYLRSLGLGRTFHVDGSFLQSLSNLEYLDFALTELSVSDTEQYLSCPFPRLKGYIGFATHIPCFIPGSAVRTTIIRCSILLPGAHWIELMACLRQSTVPIKEFSVGPLALQTDMIMTIPDYIPDLHVLILMQSVHNEQVC